MLSESSLQSGNNVKQAIGIVRDGGAANDELRVDVTSVAAHRGFRDHMAYAASKAGLEAASRVVAKELGPHGIRVNCVAPTVTLTDLAAAAWSDPEKSGPMMVRHPLGRFAGVDEVARIVAMLLSQDSEMIGAIVPVDCGFLAV